MTAFGAILGVALVLLPLALLNLGIFLNDRAELRRSAQHVKESVAEEKRRAAEAGFDTRDDYLRHLKGKRAMLHPGEGSGGPFTAWCDCPACGTFAAHYMRAPEHDDYEHARQLVDRYDLLSHPSQVFNEYSYNVIRSCRICRHSWGQGSPA